MEKKVNNFKKVYSAGFLLFRTVSEKKHEFLLLTKFNKETDIPKGHLEKGETEKQAAIRELREETSIKDNYIIDDGFYFETTYYPSYKRFFGKKVEKKLAIFLAKILNDKDLKMTEHSTYKWVEYNPPHRFDWPPTLNLLFEQISKYEAEGKLQTFLDRTDLYFKLEMKTIKKNKKGNIQNFLHSLEDRSSVSKSLNSKGIFSHDWAFLSKHFLDSKLVCMLKPPEKPEKYQFMSSQFSKNNKDQIYDQLNFLEGHVKSAYFPRELIIEDLKNDERKPVKVKGNRISVIPWVLSQNRIKYLIFYPSKAKNALELVDFEVQLSSPENIEMEVKKTKRSPEISIPEILQINKQKINNQNFINLRTSNYIVSFPISSCFLDSPPQTFEGIISNMREKITFGGSFDSELVDMKISNFFCEQNYILTAGNKIYVREDEKNSLILNSTLKDWKFNQLCSIENSFHPKNLFLLSREKAYLFDQRTANPHQLIEKTQQFNQDFYGVKHFHDQFLILSTTKAFSFYDVRYPKIPVLNFRHLLDECPPQILDFSSSFNDESLNTTSFDSDLRNFEILHEWGFTSDDDYRILFSFSPCKSGSLITNILDKSLFEEEASNKDLINISEISNDPIFTHQKFLTPMTPNLLFSSNMTLDKYKIAGVSAQKLRRDLFLIFQNDNFGGLSMQALSIDKGRIRQLGLNFKGTYDLENLINLEQLRMDRLFERNPVPRDTIQLTFDPSNQLEVFSESELEPLSQEIESRIMKFRNLDKVFKKLLRESQKTSRQAKSNSFSFSNRDFLETQNTVDTNLNNKVESSQMNFEDMIFNLTTEELSKERKTISNYYNENFMITEELEEHLKAKWDEELK